MPIQLTNTEKLAKSWTAWPVLKEAILKDIQLIQAQHTVDMVNLELELAEANVKINNLTKEIHQ